MDTARVLIQVMAGLIPEQPISEYTQTWAITSEEWYALDSGARWALMAERYKTATDYATELVVAAPNTPNWVRIDWIWL